MSSFFCLSLFLINFFLSLALLAVPVKSDGCSKEAKYFDSAEREVASAFNEGWRTSRSHPIKQFLVIFSSFFFNFLPIVLRLLHYIIGTNMPHKEVSPLELFWVQLLICYIWVKKSTTEELCLKSYYFNPIVLYSELIFLYFNHTLLR